MANRSATLFVSFLFHLFRLELWVCTRCSPALIGNIKALSFQNHWFPTYLCSFSLSFFTERRSPCLPLRAGTAPSPALSQCILPLYGESESGERDEQECSWTVLSVHIFKGVFRGVRGGGGGKWMETVWITAPLWVALNKRTKIGLGAGLGRGD